MTLLPPSDDLFFSRGDADDPRFGDVVVRVGDRAGAHEIFGRMDALGVRPRIAIVGVPQDVGVARNGGRVGAAQAPNAIRRSLYRLTTFDFESSNEVPSGFVIDLGDVDCSGELEEAHERLTDVVAEITAAGAVPVVLGGGHDITYATIMGAARTYGALGAINFDAHLDVRPPTPSRHSGTPFRMLIEAGALLPSQFIEFGIQSFANAAEHVRWLTACGGRIVTLDAVRSRGFSKSLSTAWQTVTTGAAHVYGSLDLDGVRASDAPGVSAAMPDGFTAEELLTAARQLGQRTATVGLDIVEVNPTYDRDGITARLAAHAIARFVAGVRSR